MPATNQLLDAAMLISEVNLGTFAWETTPLTSSNLIVTWAVFRDKCMVINNTAFADNYCPNYSQMITYRDLPGPSGAPSNFNATVNSSTGVVSFSWTNGDTSAKTSIEYTLNGDTTKLLVAEVQAGNTSYTSTVGWQQGDTAVFSARHLKNGKYSAYSNSKTLTWF